VIAVGTAVLVGIPAVLATLHAGLRRGSVQDPERRSGSVGRATDRPISESTVAAKVLVIEPTSNTLEASIPAP